MKLRWLLWLLWEMADDMIFFWNYALGLIRSKDHSEFYQLWLHYIMIGLLYILQWNILYIDEIKMFIIFKTLFCYAAHC